MFHLPVKMSNISFSVLRKLFEIMGVLLKDHANCMVEEDRDEIKNMLLRPLEDFVFKRRGVSLKCSFKCCINLVHVPNFRLI